MDDKKFELVKKGSFMVVGKRAVTPQPGGTWNVVRSDGSIKKIESLSPNAPTLGLCFGFDEKGQNDYMVAVEYSHEVENLDSYTYPETDWLIYRVAGKISDNVLGNAWYYINNTLLAENGLYARPKLPSWKSHFGKLEVFIY